MTAVARRDPSRPRARPRRKPPTALLAALSGSELGAGDVLVGTTKQDCGGSSNHSEQGQIGVERLPRYAYTGHADLVTAFTR